ncbi:MAG: hypothetical protein VB084_06635 [Syntrophomonadaceae bacterium]|nr:hypothetical protein [Syntrophomonadaceae bacterium]
METIPGNENMQKILAEFNTSQTADDLFTAWQNELRLRRLIRNDSDLSGITVENSNEFDFLKRCLYFGPGRKHFFDILYRNASNITVVNRVMQSPPDLVKGFLNNIGGYVLEHKPPAKDLQFIITIYSEEYRSDFIELFEQLDRDLCTQLLTRTTNKNLRRIIKQRLQQTRDQDCESNQTITDQSPADGYPTIFGDKIEIIKATIKSLQAAQPLSAAPLNRETVEILLDSGDMLFRAGLLTDCLGLLAKMVNHPGTNQNSLLLSGQEPYYRQMDALISKVLPIYALLVSPGDPHRYALDLYRGLFPGFGPDPASLAYLDIHSIVMAGWQGHHQYAGYEIAQKGGKILSLRPVDPFASALQQDDSHFAEKEWAELARDVAQRISHRLHEAYIMMEVMRLWHREGRIRLSRSAASSLLNNYLQFFNWIPAAPFMNEQVHNQLSGLADEKTRVASEQIVNIIQDEPEAAASGPKYDSDFNKLQPKLLMSKFMGVL